MKSLFSRAHGCRAAGGAAGSAAPPIGTAAFARVWDRQDRPAAERVTDRSWTWGPNPISELTRENYVEAPEGRRAVQYFDKSRMEINDPTDSIPGVRAPRAHLQPGQPTRLPRRDGQRWPALRALALWQVGRLLERLK